MLDLIALLLVLLGLITPFKLIMGIFFKGYEVDAFEIVLSIIIYTILFFIVKAFFGKTLRLKRVKRIQESIEPKPYNPEEEILIFRNSSKKYLDIYTENKKEFDGFLKNIFPQMKYGYEEKYSLFKEILLENHKEYDISTLKTVMQYVTQKRDYDEFKEELLQNVNRNSKEEIYVNYIKIFGEKSKYDKYMKCLFELVRFDLDFCDVTFTEVKEKVDEYYTSVSAEIRKQTFKGEILNENGFHKYSIDDVDLMDGFEFEEFLLSLFIKMGYKGYVTQATNDQGADLILEKLGNKIAVQAKCYTSNVSNDAIQEVVAAKAHYKCDSAMVVTNSYFTKKAKELAGCNNVKLIDRTQLAHSIEKYY